MTAKWLHWGGIFFLGAALGRAISQSYWITGTLILIGLTCVSLVPRWEGYRLAPPREAKSRL